MPTLTRKIQIYPVGDKDEVNRAFKFIRDSQYAQYQAMNLLMGQLAGKFYACGRDLNNEEFKEYRKQIMRNTNPIFEGIEFGKGVDTPSAVTQKVKQDFNTSIKNGLARGERSITNYKRTMPLITRSRNLQFYYETDNYQDFMDGFMAGNDFLYIKWVNKIRFMIVLGHSKNTHEIRCVFRNILEENYKVQGSSIQFDKSGKKLILNLSMSVPAQEHELDEDTVVGVDLGLAIPAVCGLNNNAYAREYIGNISDFLRVRTQMQAQRRRLQSQLRNTKGGHGRAKKMKAMDRLSNRERNFAQTYNHTVSRRVVDFALKNNAKYINLENLEGFQDKSGIILRNWSYYQLQQYIEYKANIHGIKVRKINPAYTSQTCSFCGNRQEGQRLSQSEFRCMNDQCKNYMKVINADWNASRNIAMSTDFTN